ncbi:hypothetical protein SK128_007319 [Halocaridina rubra]|uniref:Heparan sulfate 2-O-sulfotransferase pipe n=1 Tax=Halocaridina rubra TaxID=373956 RepID=A0AAN8XKF7_HALRR
MNMEIFDEIFEKVSPKRDVPLNVTPPNAVVLMYNRVPKCGSLSMKLRLQGLGEKNNFSFNQSPVLPHRQPPSKQVLKVKELLAKTTHTHHFWNAHRYYFDAVGNYGGKVVWMNMIRDPVERFISEFYWLRNGLGKAYLKNAVRGKGGNNHDVNEAPRLELNECAAAGHPLCTWTVWPPGELQLSYVCGMNESCTERGNRWALQQAKYNMDRYYGVVGLLEELPLSLAVFEAYIPRFFKDCNQIKADEIVSHVQSSSDKPKVTNATKAILKNNLKEDYEFYDYVRQRLHRQAANAGITLSNEIKSHVQTEKQKKYVTNATKEFLRNNLKEDYEFYTYAQQRLHLQAGAAGIEAIQ